MKTGANKSDIAKIQKYAAGRPEDNISGMSAQQISKVMNISVKCVKAFMNPDEVSEASAKKIADNKAREAKEEEDRLDDDAEKAAAAAERVAKKTKAKK